MFRTSTLTHAVPETMHMLGSKPATRLGATALLAAGPAGVGMRGAGFVARESPEGETGVDFALVARRA